MDKTKYKSGIVFSVLICQKMKYWLRLSGKSFSLIIFRIHQVSYVNLEIQNL